VHLFWYIIPDQSVADSTCIILCCIMCDSFCKMRNVSDVTLMWMSCRIHFCLSVTT